MRRALLAAALTLAAAAPAGALVEHGRASTYGNDRSIGWIDRGDNNRPALAGATNDRAGIAVAHWWTLGHWWRVCSPWRVCRWVQQTDFGPVPPRVLDVNAVAARALWGRPAPSFPTDEGTWTLALAGRRLTRPQLYQARRERCHTEACRRRWAPRRRYHAHVRARPSRRKTATTFRAVTDR